MERRCPICTGLIAATSRPDRHYCSRACKQIAYERRRREAAGLEYVVPRAGLDAELEQALARATEETRLLARVAAASRTDWRASAWILQRRYPERWAGRPRPVAEPEPDKRPDAPDAFAEVDELARKRRRMGSPPTGTGRSDRRS
jgi:predicted nucleic acid-binding Zn ribbon protein